MSALAWTGGHIMVIKIFSLRTVNTDLTMISTVASDLSQEICRLRSPFDTIWMAWRSRYPLHSSSIALFALNNFTRVQQNRRRKYTICASGQPSYQIIYSSKYSSKPCRLVNNPLLSPLTIDSEVFVHVDCFFFA